MRKVLFFLLLTLLLSVGECRRRMGRSTGGARTGAVLGGGVVTLIKDLRQKPQPLTKGYKREVEKPQVEEYTLWYKFKQGLKNFQYLAYFLGILLVLGGIYQLYKLISLTYLRYKISQLPPEQQGELLEQAMALQKPTSPKKEVSCEDPHKTRDLRLKYDQRRKLKR